MRTAVISDIHANLDALTAVLDDVERQDVAATVCCGDIVGYHADANECIALLEERGVCCIAGNHDLAASGRKQDLGSFSPRAARAVVWTRGQLSEAARGFLQWLPKTRVVDDRFLLLHGGLHPDETPEDTRLLEGETILETFKALAAHPSGVRLAFFGHIHRQVVYRYGDGKLEHIAPGDTVPLAGGHYLVNPGSVGQPRDGDARAAYLIYDAESATLRFRRVAYDGRGCLGRSRRAGLLPGRGQRLRRRAGRLLSAVSGFVTRSSAD